MSAIMTDQADKGIVNENAVLGCRGGTMEIIKVITTLRLKHHT